MKKNTKLSLHLTFATLLTIFIFLWLLIYFLGILLYNHFGKQFITGIEKKSYLIEYNIENISSIEELEKKYDEDWYFVDPKKDYFLKENGKIGKLGLTKLFKTDLSFLNNLDNGDYTLQKIGTKDYFFYNSKNDNKIYFTNLFVKEIIELLYELLFYFLIIIIIPIFLLIKKLLVLYFKPIEESNLKLKKYNHNLAHEIKNPISSILINLEVLKNNFDKSLIKEIEKETKTINRITDTLLSFAEKTKTQKLDYYNLKNLLNDFENSLNSVEKSSFMLNGSFNIKIQTDIDLFNIILKNIFENALKYSNDKKVNIYRDKKSLIFKNTLNKNIPSSEINKLLNFFHRYNGLKKKGFGLGLGIVKSICDELNYNIDIKSENKEFILELKFN